MDFSWPARLGRDRLRTISFGGDFLLHGICEWAVHTKVDADGLEGIDCIVYGVGLSYDDDKYSLSALGP